MSCAFSTTLFLSNTPGAFAKNTLPSPLAETPHRSAATGRFRVLWCHTRELCGKNMKISRNHVVKPHTPSTELIRTSQNFSLVFCSERAGRRAWPLFFARTRRNSPHPPLPPCSCGDGRKFWRRLFLFFQSLQIPL